MSGFMQKRFIDMALRIAKSNNPRGADRQLTPARIDVAKVIRFLANRAVLNDSNLLPHELTNLHRNRGQIGDIVHSVGRARLDQTITTETVGICGEQRANDAQSSLELSVESSLESSVESSS